MRRALSPSGWRAPVAGDRGLLLATPGLALVVLAILWPVLVTPGYVLLLDWAWTPFGMMFQPTHHFPAWEAWGSGDYPLNAVPLQGLLRVLGLAIPEWVLQRLFLLVVFGGMAVSGWLLAPTARRPARAYCALVVLVNPVVYDRFLAGQWFMLTAAAALPLAMLGLLRALRLGGLRNVLLGALAAGLLGIANNHTFYLFLFVVPLAAFAFIAAERFQARAWLRYAARAGAYLAVMALLTAYWTVPALADLGLSATVDRRDLAQFATRPDETFGLLFNTASMHGFWTAAAEATETLRVWWALFALIAALAVAGATLGLRAPSLRGETLAVVLVGVAAVLFAMGPDFAPTASPFLWAFDHVPGMRGLREPQRAAIFMPLAYGYLGALAIDALLRRRRGERMQRHMAAAAAVASLYAVVLLYSFRLFWGGAGAVTPAEYPEAWSEARAIVTADPDSAVLVLPWQKFIELPFTGRQVLNPAPRFFGDRALVADSEHLPIGGALSLDRRHRYVDALLERRAQIGHFGNLVSVLGVRYILVLDSVEARGDLAFLDRQHDVRPVRSWAGVHLYENARPAGLFYASSAPREVASIDELIALSEEVELTRYVWMEGSGGAAGGEAGGPPGTPRVKRTGPASFQVEDPGGALLQTAAVSPPPQWQLEGQAPLPTLLPVLAWKGTSGTLSASVVGRLAPTYVLSALAAFAAVGALLLDARGLLPRPVWASRRARAAAPVTRSEPSGRGVGSKPPD